MQAKPECRDCCLRQMENTLRLLNVEPAARERAEARIADHVARASLLQTPAALSQPVYEVIAAMTGVADPYEQQKRENNRAALAILPDIEAIVDGSSDPLDAALHAAVAGNVIDLGIGQAFDIEKDIVELMRRPFAIDALADFRGEIGKGRRLLYLGDNAGEIVFDTLLVKQILTTGTLVTYVVKSGPIINDATALDAEEVGMTRLAPVIESGGSDIGINWDNVSGEFLAAWNAADIVLAKGHGNFETCDDRPGNLYFLLKAKCDTVAAELGVTPGDIVFKHRGESGMWEGGQGDRRQG